MTCPNSSVVQADIDALERDCGAVEKYTTKKIAHLSLSQEGIIPPKFGEIDVAVATLELHSLAEHGAGVLAPRLAREARKLLREDVARRRIEEELEAVRGGGRARGGEQDRGDENPDGGAHRDSSDGPEDARGRSAALWKGLHSPEGFLRRRRRRTAAPALVRSAAPGSGTEFPTPSESSML